MIDIHSHILPGFDDGAKNLEDSLTMAKAAVKEGIKTIIATPHHKNGIYYSNKQDILHAVDELNLVFLQKEIPLHILSGQETRINGEMLQDLEQGNIVQLNEDSGYIFVEFPSDHVPRYATKLLFDLQLSGYKPIIVHPERNQELIQNPNLLYHFVEKGALTQVTAASVCGYFGKKVQKFTHQVIESNLTHFVASDAHNTTTRGFHMQEAFDLISEKFGHDMHYFFVENAELMVHGHMVVGDPPMKIGRKKIFGLF